VHVLPAPKLTRCAVKIPVGTRVVGEAWSVIMAGGPAFNDQANPKVAVQVGAEGDKGVMEISDVM
jgi:glucan 1,3-beta-glucosidase